MSDKRNPEAAILGAPEITCGAGSDANSTRALADRAAYAIVVLAGMRNGGSRRRVFSNLPNAEKAVERCTGRGLPASLHLVRLLPVPMADLDSLDLDSLGGGARV